MGKKVFTLFLSFAMVFTMLFANVGLVFAADSDWTYSASGNKITATRTRQSRTTTATVTVTAKDVEYDGQTHAATVTADSNWRNNITVPTAKYYQDGVEMSSTPKEIGKYEARITAGGKTAKVEYNITKAVVPWTYTLYNYEAEQDDDVAEFDTIVATRTVDGVEERYELTLKPTEEPYDGNPHASYFDPEELAAWEANPDLPSISDLGTLSYYQDGDSYKTGDDLKNDIKLSSAPTDQGFYETKFAFKNGITLRYWDEESQSYKQPPYKRIEVEFTIYTIDFTGTENELAVHKEVTSKWGKSSSSHPAEVEVTTVGDQVLVISASDVEYDGEEHAATLSGDQKAWAKLAKTVPEIQYYTLVNGVKTPFDGVPTEAGYYDAEISQGGATAGVRYHIYKEEMEFSADENVLTAEEWKIPSESGDPVGEVINTWNLTISAQDADYDGKEHGAVIGELEDTEAWVEQFGALPTINYFQVVDGVEVDITGVPSEPGDYVAKISVGDAVAEAPYTIYEHDWVFSADDNALVATEVYHLSGEPTGVVKTLTLTAKDATYDAKAHAASIAKAEKDAWEAEFGTVPEIKYFTADGEEVVGTPTNADSYVAKIAWGEKVAEKAYTINPKEVVVTANSISKYVGQPAPKESALTYKVTGLLGKDAAVVEPQLAYSPKGDTSKEGTITIKASGADYGQNYAVKYVNGKLTVKTPAMTKLIAKVTANTSNNNFKFNWIKHTGATKYVVYGSECPQKGTKKLATAKGTSTTITVKKIGSKTKSHTGYKFYVKAYDKNGKLLATSLLLHSISRQTQGKAANSTAIKATKTSATLDKGKTVKLGAKVTVYKKMMHLPDHKVGKAISHSKDAHLRFITSNKYVATVDSKGTVTAKGYGTCIVYVCDTNGMWVKVPVTVAAPAVPL